MSRGPTERVIWFLRLRISAVALLPCRLTAQIPPRSGRLSVQLLVAMGGGWWDADLTVANNNDHPQGMHRD
jgi:hypothetical protein